MAAVDRILFVWDSDSGWLGHLRYAAGLLRGRSCALCDLSYAGVRPSEAFKACQASMPIPIEPLYRDQLSPAMAAVIGGAFPSVVVDEGGKFSVLLGPAELADFDSFERLEASIRSAVDQPAKSGARAAE